MIRALRRYLGGQEKVPTRRSLTAGGKFCEVHERGTRERGTAN